MIRTKIMKKISFLFIFIFFYGIISAYNRDSWTQPEKVMDVIGVKEGMNIGVVGAGRGYFTFKMSKRVGDKGKIFANEISSGKLDYIRNKYKKEGITNITAVLGKIDDPLFPEGKLDIVFMCYVFHHLEMHVEFFRNIKRSLKQGAIVVIFEQDPGKTGSTHFYTQKVILRKVKEAAYKVLRIETFLKKDNIYICIPET